MSPPDTSSREADSSPSDPSQPGDIPGRQQRELDHWRRWQTRADTIWGWQTPAGQARAHRRATLFLELARIDPRSCVLEIGCGTGEFTARIAPHTRELVATDLSPELLDRARARLASITPPPPVGFEIQDAMHMHLAPGTFDAAFGCSVLHHLDAPQALREILRLLKPGGRLAFSEPNMLNPQIALQKNIPFIKRRVGDSPDETAFFKPQMQRLLASAGFVDIQVTPFDFLHPLTPRALIPCVAGLGRLAEKLPILRSFAGSLIISAGKPHTNPRPPSGKPPGA